MKSGVDQACGEDIMMCKNNGICYVDSSIRSQESPAVTVTHRRFDQLRKP